MESSVNIEITKVVAPAIVTLLVNRRAKINEAKTIARNFGDRCF
jgi:hypothetical protein